MTKKMIENRIIKTSNNKLFCLKYYLTEKLLTLSDSFEKKIIYGVVVEKYNVHEENEVFISSEEVNAVSYELDFVANIVKILANGTVTPTNLLEILDDMIE